MIRVVSYNIRKAVGLDWRRDPMRVARVIADTGGDIVALQEVDKRLGPRPTALPPEAVAATHLSPVPTGDGPNLGWHGNAILVRPGWTVGTVERWNLPGLEPRGALFAQIETPDGEIFICATHLGLARGSRRRQMRDMIEWIGPERLPRTVLMGDLNEWSRSTGFRMIEAHLTLLDPGPSFHAARPVAHLDRVAHGPAWRAAETGVHRAAPAPRASDHLPIFADLHPVFATDTAGA